MAIQTSGAISFQDLVDEFTTGKPISLGQMYRGGAFVPNATANNNVPLSGIIKLSDFYGATASYVHSHTVTNNTFNLTTDAILSATDWDGNIPVDLTINIPTGIVVSANTTANNAVLINTLPTGSVVTLNNAGTIVGMGGAGVSNAEGEAGGTALFIKVPTRVNNTGIIAGGGGGGGGARMRRDGSLTYYAGGGGGRSGLQEAIGGQASASASGSNPNAGTNGTFTSAGLGGGKWTDGAWSTGNSLGFRGGEGGGWGEQGVTAYRSGTGYTFTPFEGGAGGKAMISSSQVTWLSLGTIYGDIT